MRSPPKRTSRAALTDPRVARLRGHRTWRKALGSVSLLALLAGCAANKPLIPAPLKVEKHPESTARAMADAADKDAAHTEFYDTPSTPKRGRTVANAAPTPSQTPRATEPLGANVALDAVPLPQFIQTVFSTILKRNVSIDPAIADRKELVSLRTGQPQTAQSLFVAARAVLRSYGIAVTEFDGLVRVTPDTAQSGYLPEIRRGRANPEVPPALRPIFYLAELEHTGATNAANWLRTAFQGKVTVQDDASRNAILLSGQSDNIAAALEALQVLDQPLLRGHMSKRISPVYWTADEMTRRLSEILAAEGYYVGQAPGMPTPVILLSIPAINSVIVFAANENLINHTLRWARELDQPAKVRGNAGYFTYPVRNIDAADLAKTLQEVISGQSSQPAATSPSTPGQPAAPAPVAARGNRVVVNPATNSLIIQGSPSEYQQWHSLLQELDRPARNAMISVTVAELRLGDREQLGFQWLIKEFVANGYRVNTNVNAFTGFPASIGGLAVSIAGSAGDPRAFIQALASTDRLRILSNPSVVTRNGEAATIQVGQEVPTITSQVSNSNTSLGASAGILQTVQYRNTGVILKVKPVIHAGGRVDLDVAQEVSSAQQTTTGVTSSPTILTRRVETKLSVGDGSTVLLGGLMQNSVDHSESGIPLLKDVPVVGNIFKTNIDRVDRTELVVLITPYVIENDFEAQAVTNAFRAQFPWAATQTNLPPVDGAPLGTMPVPARRPAGNSAEGSGLGAAQTPTDPLGNRPNSPRYQLPESDAPNTKTPASQTESVGQLPQHSAPVTTENPPLPAPRQPAAAPASAAGPATPSPQREKQGNSRPPSTPTPAGKTVTDDKLKQELLDAIKRSQ
jgi:general secretion pathway protein D